MANLSPFGPQVQYEDSAGLPAVGYRLFFYVNNSVGTKQNTYTTAAGSVANTNPIVLNALGEPAQGIFFPAGNAYTIQYAPPGTDDPPNSPIWTRNDVYGINDTASSGIDQWVAFSGAPTFVGTTQFTLVGDQTSAFHVGRRVKTVNSGGDVYSRITASVFGAVTTVTVANDGAGVLDSGLSAVSYGLLTSINPSTPLLRDSQPIISGSVDPTKILRLEVDGFTTATTRVLTPPDQDLAIAKLNAAGSDWQATSAGVTAERVVGTTGQISITAASGLKAWANPVSVQTFSTAGSGTPWTKPTNVSPTAMVYIQAWGGGGSGGKGAGSQPAGGGGGGAYNERWLPISLLASSETVTVGAGGPAQTAGGTAGTAGGNTTFGSLLTAYGGGAGGVAAAGGGGGGGGGALGAGVSATTGAGGLGGGPSIAAVAGIKVSLQGSGGLLPAVSDVDVVIGGPNNMGGGGGGGAGTDSGAQPIQGNGGDSAWGGGGGGAGRDAAGSAAVNRGGNSYYGGGGGGGAANSGTGGTAGSSVLGGAGSAGAFDSNTSAAGTQPAGGSGGTEGGDSGKGGDGRVIVYVFNGS